MTKILGISAFYHDSAATLIDNGAILNAVQEERFTRVKHDYSFPTNSIKFILKQNKIKLHEIDYITFYEKPIIIYNSISYKANNLQDLLKLDKEKLNKLKFTGEKNLAA